MKRKITLIFSFILLLILNNNLKVFAEDINTYGKLNINKTASKESIAYGKTANIELEISSYNKEKSKLDIILLIDRSSSMNNKIKNEKKITLVKEATINLITNLSKNDNINLGIITFGKQVFNKYSTNNMNYSKDNLIKLVNSIPSNNNESGTNIHEALISANNILKNTKNEKVVILLSDGLPTKFTYNNQILGNGTNDICYKYENNICIKSNPLKMATNIANEIKEYASIYTIGFDVEKNSSAESFLKNNIASNKDNYYSKTSDLNKTFNDILKNITIIANNVTVTDIIPSYFELINNSISTNNNTSYKVIKNNDNTTIEWKIDSIDITKTYNLNYKIKALLPYYGNIYTNTSALLQGTPTKNNKYYKDNISNYFNKPTIPIPSTTNDDDYTSNLIYRNETLHIDNKSGLLKNDYLTKIKDNNIDSTDKIIIKNNSISCGNISDIKINNDGSFTYDSNLDCLGNITFEYYISSLINDTEVLSNTSKVSLNIIKKNTTYKVKYLDYETKLPLHKEKVVKDIYLYDEINENYIDIADYNLVGNKTINKVINKENDEIIFYYVKPNNLTYVVNYYYDGILDIDETEIVTNNTLSSIINDYQDKNKYGYILDYEENLPLTISNNIEKNIINIYYKKNVGKIIIKYVDNQGVYLKDPFTMKKLVGDEYKTSKEIINGYELIDIIGDETGIVKENDTIITYVYDFIIPKTGNNDNYNKELLSILSIIGIILINIKKKIG